MHSTISTAARARRLACVALLAALLLLAFAAPAPAAQRPDYTGGPVPANGDLKPDFPAYVPNDHTAWALRFTADPGTLYDAAGDLVTTSGVQYNVKVRLTPNADGSPAGVNNRGFTWNPTTQRWVQERDDWADFPVATTGAGGGIAAGSSSWYYVCFGDTTKFGTYHLLVSLQPVGAGSGTTQNNAAPPAVTVLDMTGLLTGATPGFLVHNGIATGVIGKRAEVTDGADPAGVWALTRSTDTASTAPLQIMPDMWTGADAASGDFALGVPLGAAFDARLQNAIWPAGASSFTGSLADVNIALGAVETTPPSAPSTLSVTRGNGKAILAWGAATDDTGVDSYLIYRYEDASLGSGYTPLPEAVATVSGSTTYTDTGLTNGTTYNYLVRAEDAATNVGPRSNTVSVTPSDAVTLTLSAAPTVVNWGKPWTLSGELKDGDGNAVPDATVELQASVDGGVTWSTKVPDVVPAPGTSTYQASIAAPRRKTLYRLYFAGDGMNPAGASHQVKVSPKVKLGKPHAPARVRRAAKFFVYGSVAPKQAAGSKTVRVKCYLRKSGKWVLKKSVRATNVNRSSSTRYQVRLRLPYRGTWKLVAYYASNSKYASTTSGGDYLRAK
jgi:hypothetical protein